MNRKKVCVMTSVHRPFDTRIFYKQCRSLVNSGYDVILVVPHNKNEVVSGIEIDAVPKPSTRLQRFVKTGYQVYRKARQSGATIVHVHDPELLPYAQLLRLQGKKVIFDMHENLPRQILTKKWIPQVTRRIVSSFVRIVERCLYSGMQIVFAESSYKKDYPWVFNGVDILNMPDVEYLMKLEVTNKETSFAIGYIGGVSAERGSLRMIEAVGTLQKQGSDCSFHCVGPSNPEHLIELENMIKEQRIRNVFMYGYLQPRDAWNIIQKCHVGLAILDPIPNYVDSYPTKIFEYMALSMPVITSNFPLYKEVVEFNECGLCVNPISVQELADAINIVATQPQRAAAMGEKGLQAVKEKYSWVNEEKKLIKMYRELLGF